MPVRYAAERDTQAYPCSDLPILAIEEVERLAYREATFLVRMTAWTVESRPRTGQVALVAPFCF